MNEDTEIRILKYSPGIFRNEIESIGIGLGPVGVREDFFTRRVSMGPELVKVNEITSCLHTSTITISHECVIVQGGQ